MQAWEVVFILRIWKRSILEEYEEKLKIYVEKKDHIKKLKKGKKTEKPVEPIKPTLKFDSFISKPAYDCAEVNAHTLVMLIIKFREENLENCFLPWLMSSQSNEALFRKLRTFTTTFYTQMNFSLIEVMQKLKRIECLSQIELDLAKLGVHVNGNKSSKDSNPTQKFPTNAEILEVIKKAKFNAVVQMTRLGTKLKSYGRILKPTSKVNNLDTNEELKPVILDPEEMMYQIGMQNVEVILNDNVEYIQNSEETKIMKELCGIDMQKVFINNNSDKFEMQDNNEFKKFNKQTMCWVFQNPETVTNDRIKRFIASNKEVPEFFNVENGILQQLQVVHTGDWIILSDCFEVFKVLHFIILVKSSGMLVKTKPFSRKYAFIEDPSKKVIKKMKKSKNETKKTTNIHKESLAMICHMYRMNSEKKLEWIPEKRHIDITSYAAHLPNLFSTKLELSLKTSAIETLCLRVDENDSSINFLNKLIKI